ncbi:MAG TPA: laccase domain-containing protein, partial [Firmicutes bacterium]|nr:laccase domain-containing protein [Bacillota bacterium]
CYRVSRERFRLFQTTWPEVELLTSGEGYSLNLEKINYHHLVNSGLRTENIDCANLCTSCQVESFYSYRREQETGRMLSLVALK